MSKQALLGAVLLAGCASAVWAYDNSASSVLIIPEAIWADATGGGTWRTSLQISSMTDDARISVAFCYGGGLWRGPFEIEPDLDRFQSVQFNNILATMNQQDEGIDYFGRVGALTIQTQGTGYKIHAIARTVNGNFGKTFPGLTEADANCAAVGRKMMIQEMAKTSTYRTFVGFFNGSLSPLTVDFRLMTGGGWVVGSTISLTFAAFDYRAFDPFALAGVSGGANYYLEIVPVSGSGRLYGFGSSANNSTNDTYAHLMVHWE